jgi:tRNA A-37 threonylcarbamoyl transferase component Bud32
MPGWTLVTAGGVRWQVLADCREPLLGPDGLRLAEWLQSGRATVVKQGPHRVVYRVLLPGLHFYLKHYCLADLRARLRQLVRPSKARMEFERAVAVAARQVPTIVPLALGERLCGQTARESFLITQTLDDAEALNTFLTATLPKFDGPRQVRIRQRLARALGQLVARLHLAGIAHRDLHAANVLARLRPDDDVALYLIDLHNVRVGSALDWPTSRDNLVLLNRWFILTAHRGDRLRFWRAYCRTRRQEGAPGEEWHDERGEELERATWASNLRFWRRRDRRCLQTNRYFCRVRGPAVTGHAVRGLDTALDALLTDPDAPFRRPGVRLLKDSRSSTVAEFDFPVQGVPRRVIYKRFRVTAWSDTWLALFRPSAALRSWVNGHGVRERLLPTPRPLAVFHRRRAGRPAEGYLLTEKVPDALDLHAHLARLQALDPAAARAGRRRLIDQLAGLARALHRRRLSHRDFKAANVLVNEQGPWLIDLVGVRLCRRLTRARRVQNLARLHASFCHNPAVTRTDKLRFLRAYLAWGLHGRPRWKRWWREIEAATQAKVERNHRSGRLLA